MISYTQRVYVDVDSMWVDLVKDLLECGDAAVAAGRTPQSSRDGDVYGEIIGWSASLDASECRTFVCNRGRSLSPSYAAAETLWYLSGGDDVSMISRYAPSYAKFADSQGRAHGAYGPRIMPQLPKIIDALRAQRSTRQAVVAVWRPDDADMLGKTPDMPCTLHHQFIVRDNKLHMIVHMRSNDAWLGFPYDVFAFTCIQRIVACTLGYDVGMYHHHVGSMHLYSRSVDRARLCLLHGRRRVSAAHGWGMTDRLDSAQRAVDIERRLRVNGTLDLEELDKLGCMCRDLVVACENKIGSKTLKTRSEALR